MMFTFTLHLYRIRVGEAMNFRFPDHTSVYLLCQIKGRTKQTTELVNIQSVLCEDAMCLKRIILV